MSNRHFIVIPEWKVCFGRVPKVANTSIKGVLAERLGLSHEKLKPTNDAFWHAASSGNKTDLKSAEELILSHQGYFTFAFVREPRDRLMSFFNANIRKWQLRPQLARLGFKKDMSVSEFVARVCEIDDDEADVHFLSQARILSWRGQLVPTLVGRFDHLDRDWERVSRVVRELRSVELPLRLGVSNRLKKDASDVERLFDESNSKRIFRRYEEDYDLFFSKPS
jgi:hypothetical protein